MDFNKKTKIIATIGPSSDSSFRMRKLIESGVDVFRFNTKHSTIDWHNLRIGRAQKVAKKMKKKIGIMIDLQGSEIRIETREGKDFLAKKGEIVHLGKDFSSQDVSLAVSDKKIFENLKKNRLILVDSGMISFKVLENKDGMAKLKVIDGGVVRSRKSINFPGMKTSLRSFIKNDIENLKSAARNNVTFISLSFVSSSDDIHVLRKEMDRLGIKGSVVSKIENKDAINNIDEIIKESDAIMIARGDLGIEVPIEKLAFWQKEITRKCREARKPVIVATQMLYSMTKNSRPTRAEAIDVANSVFDGTDAVMLSEETAIGKHPAKVASEMSKILKFNEGKSFLPDIAAPSSSITEFITSAIARELGKKEIKVKTIIIFTESGYTARVLSAFRPKAKIIAITNNKKTVRKLSLSYGVIPFFAPAKFDNLQIPEKIIKNLKKEKLISSDEIVAVFHGRYDKKPGLLGLFSLTKIK